jgi:uncharacterized membrane protein (Fun14 family)
MTAIIVIGIVYIVVLQLAYIWTVETRIAAIARLVQRLCEAITRTHDAVAAHDPGAANTADRAGGPQDAEKAHVREEVL